MPQNFINVISNHNNLFYRRIRNEYIGFDIDGKKTICSILETVTKRNFFYDISRMKHILPDIPFDANEFTKFNFWVTGFLMFYTHHFFPDALPFTY